MQTYSGCECLLNLKDKFNLKKLKKIKRNAHIFTGKKSKCIILFQRSLQSIAPAISGSRVQCQAPADTASSFLAPTSVLWAVSLKAAGSVTVSNVVDITCSFFIHRFLLMNDAARRAEMWQRVRRRRTCTRCHVGEVSLMCWDRRVWGAGVCYKSHPKYMCNMLQRVTLAFKMCINNTQ